MNNPSKALIPASLFIDHVEELIFKAEQHVAAVEQNFKEGRMDGLGAACNMSHEIAKFEEAVKPLVSMLQTGGNELLPVVDELRRLRSEAVSRMKKHVDALFESGNRA